MSATTNAEWVQRARDIRIRVRGLILDVAALSLHAQANDLTAAITAAVEGKSSVVQGTDMAPGDALALVAVFQAFEAFLDEPAVEGGLARRLVLFRDEQVT